MPKVTLDSISAGYADIDLLNANFTAISDAIDNTLSRDGTTPNTMSSNLDMNSNRIINLAAPASDSDIATKTYVDSLIAAIASSNTPTPEKFNGGSQTYTLGTAVDSSDILVFLDGAVQIAEDAYEIIGGTTLSFHTTTPSGTNNIVVVYLTDNNFSTVTPDNSVDADKIVDGSVTTAKIAADAVTGAKIADDSIDSEHYVDGSIDTEHIADNQITTAKLVDDSVTISKIADAAIVTESEGISSNDNDTTLPTSAAVKDYVDTEVSNVTPFAAACTFNGTGTPSFTQNSGFTGITDNGVGNWTLSSSSITSNSIVLVTAQGANSFCYLGSAPTSGSVNIRTKVDDGGGYDSAYISVVVYNL